MDTGLLEVVQEAHRYGFTCKSDFARRQAAYVAMAASLQLISTKVTNGIYSLEWRPTVQGLMFLNEMEDEPKDEPI